MAKRYVNLDRNQAGIIQAKYGCAGCWNHVNVCHDKDGDYLDCGTADCPCNGLVTLRWIEYQIKDSEQIAAAAREILHNALPWVRIVRDRAPRSIKQNLQQLGF